MTDKEKETLMEEFRVEFDKYTGLTDRLLKAYMSLPPMGEMTLELIANESVERKELFQIAFMQGVITAKRASDPGALMHEYFKKAL